MRRVWWRQAANELEFVLACWFLTQRGVQDSRSPPLLPLFLEKDLAHPPAEKAEKALKHADSTACAISSPPKFFEHTEFPCASL